MIKIMPNKLIMIIGKSEIIQTADKITLQAGVIDVK